MLPTGDAVTSVSWAFLGAQVEVLEIVEPECTGQFSCRIRLLEEGSVTVRATADDQPCLFDDTPMTKTTTIAAECFEAEVAAPDRLCPGATAVVSLVPLEQICDIACMEGLIEWDISGEGVKLREVEWCDGSPEGCPNPTPPGDPDDCVPYGFTREIVVQDDARSNVVTVTCRVGLCEYTTDIEIGCASCEGGQCTAGSGDFGLGGGASSGGTGGRGGAVRQIPRGLLGMGKGEGGRSGGKLHFIMPTPDGEADFVGVVYGLEKSGRSDVGAVFVDGNLSQVYAPEAFTDIQYNIVGSDYVTEIKFYMTRLAEWNGIRYVPGPECPTFATWTASQPVNDDTRITITKWNVPTPLERYEFAGSIGSRNWSLCRSGITGQLERESATWTGTGPFYRTYVVEGYISNAWQVKYKERTTHTLEDGPWTVKVVDPDGTPLVTSRELAADDRLVWEEDPDGSWRWCTYAEDLPSPGHRLVTTYTPWGGTVRPVTAPTTATAGVHAVNTEYDEYGRVLDVREYVNESGAAQVEVSHTAYQYTPGSGMIFGVPRVASVQEDRYTSDTLFLRTTTYYDSADPDNRDLDRVEHPDGRVDDYGTSREADYTFNETGPTWTLLGGTHESTIVYHNGPGGTNGVPVENKSTKVVTIHDKLGRLVYSETYLYVSGAYSAAPVTWTAWLHDDLGRVTDVYRSNGTREHTDYADCCGDRTVTDAFGARTTYEHDALHRPTLVHREELRGFSVEGDVFLALPAVTTTYQYGYGGNPRSTCATTTSTDNTLATPETITQTSISVYDMLGRLVEERSGSDEQVDLKTMHVYANTQHGYSVTAYRDYALGASAGTPGLRDEVTEYYRDGRVRSRSGGAVIPEAYRYATAAGSETTTTLIGTADPTSQNWPRWTAITTDMLGRVLMESRPAFGGGTVQTDYTYWPNGNAGAGQLMYRQTDGRAAEWTYYDALGQANRTGEDYDDPPDGLELFGTDRITDVITQYTFQDSEYWRSRTVTTYVDQAGTPKQIESQRTQLSGLSLALFGKSVAVDALGNETVSQSSLTRLSYQPTPPGVEWPAYVTQTTTFEQLPGSQGAKQIAYQGLTLLDASQTGAKVSYFYDGFGRQVYVVGPRAGTWSHTNYSRTTNRVESVESSPENELDPPITTSYAYYGPADYLGLETPPGGVKSVTNHLGSDTYYAYNARGDVTKTWGDVPQPTYVTYDEYGQRETLHTYRSTSPNWSAATWPDPGDGDVTTWNYDEPTGLLTSKTYDDSSSVSYSYTPDGKLETRTWARGDTTTYSYYPLTDEVHQINYLGGDPEVTFTYTRVGQIASVTDANAEATDHVFDYSLWPELVTESISGPFTKTITRTTAAAGSGNLTGVTIGTDYNADYTYSSATGRLERVTGPGLPTGGSNAYGAWYTYKWGCDLVRYLDIKNDSGAVRVRTERAYEPNRDLLDFVQHTLEPVPPNPSGANALISNYDYHNDALGLRDGLAYTGAAFTGSPTQSFGYNPRNELTGSSRSDVGNWTYTYDPIGNRSQAQWPDGGGQYTTAYTADELNAYERADTTGPGAPAKQRFMYDADGNLTRALIAGDMNCDGAVNALDINPFVQAMTNREAYEAAYPNCNYYNGDIDGNGVVNALDINPFTQLQNNNAAPDLTYTWDAENRLVAVQPATPAPGDQRVEFAYDYQGRRVLKQVRPWVGPGPDDWAAQPSLVRRFVWSDWLLLMELDGNNNVVRKYTWGLDLAGQNGTINSLEAAGGIGGLLAVEQAVIDYPEPGPPDVPAGNYVYTYDGNGNVVQVLDWAASDAEAAIVARYEYDPYGVIIGPDLDADGDWTDDAEPYALENRLRFSTKYYDSETGLSYFGYRYYSAKLGRWVSRDPIEEDGAFNLSVFVQNEPIFSTDSVGLAFDCWYDRSTGQTVCPSGQSGGSSRGNFKAAIEAFVRGVAPKKGCITRDFDLSDLLTGGLGAPRGEKWYITKTAKKLIQTLSTVNAKASFEVCTDCNCTTVKVAGSGSVKLPGSNPAVTIASTFEVGGSAKYCCDGTQNWDIFACVGVSVRAKFDAWVAGVQGNFSIKGCGSVQRGAYATLNVAGSYYVNRLLWTDKGSFGKTFCLAGNCSGDDNLFGDSP